MKRENLKITVWEYINNRDDTFYGKNIRLLDYHTHKTLGCWWDNPSAEIQAIKITSKYIFIFI